MPTKTYLGEGRYLVEFRISPDAATTAASVVGEFNDWDTDATPLERRDDGSLAATVELAAGCSYRFRYLLDHDRWENDWAADAYEENEFGGSDSVVTLPAD